MDTMIYFKALLLVAGSVSAQYAFTAPTPPAALDEQGAYKKDKGTAGFGESGWTIIHAANFVKVWDSLFNGCLVISEAE